MDKTYLIISLGCAKNLVDTEKALGPLEAAGWRRVDCDPDIVVINTCGFLASARAEARAVIAEMRHNYPATPLIVIGCLVNYLGKSARHHLAANAVLPSSRIAELPSLAAKLCHITMPKTSPGRYLRARVTLPHVAYLKIAEGCDNRCGYCTIPGISGPLVSRAEDDVLEEAQQLVASGVRELILLAHDTTAYGMDWDGKSHLPALLSVVAESFPMVWIRLLYSHPIRVNSRLLSVMREHSNICRYLDVPMQHVVPRILGLMRRMLILHPVHLWQQWREELPGVAIRTTLLAGFPSETKDEFNALLEFVQEAKPDSGGVFAYSPERGTAAAKLPGRLPKRERERRARVLGEAMVQSAVESAAQKISTEQDVMVDVAETCSRPAVGRARGQAPDVDGVTYLIGRGYTPGEVVTARIVESSGIDLVGERMDN
jgi:ribosomal protein S12 methylthiotransferase